jgi:hypothetical protein
MEIFFQEFIQRLNTADLKSKLTGFHPEMALFPGSFVLRVLIP